VGSPRGHWALVAALFVLALGASAAAASPLHVLIRHSPNMTQSNRTARTIDAIVIHSTEGRFVGSVRYLQRRRTRGSAHFVVSRLGQVVQLVPVTDVAWHSGNGWWNLHAIGIEHEGWVNRNGFTEAEYRASAQLVAYLAHRWGIPLDRRHIIGHNEVPNPHWPGHFGGVDGHVDPGPYWRWGKYMALVRWYSHHRVLPTFVHAMVLHDSTPPPVARGHARHRWVQMRSVVDRGARVRGKALWWSGIDADRRWRHHIYKVDFLVDGTRRYTDNTWPFAFHRTIGWDSTTVANGRHLLTVLAYGRHGYRTRKRVPVRVVNPPITLSIAGAATGEAVAGELQLDVSPSAAVQRVTLYADHKAVSRDDSPPYTLHWDTTAVGEGTHDLLVYARAAHGRRAATELPLVVANSDQFPTALSDDWLTSRTIADR
jgi:N-acetyl-anhydromuramyl-L-alanine amidase AmpD